MLATPEIFFELDHLFQKIKVSILKEMIPKVLTKKPHLASL